ncbi:DNA replication/checkpoint protein [Macrophomina phaseolina]|uniref:DNA replication regulator SLD2 n=1 Tax=Macrophomina phaseolina TaxID=35725 RepID=A0ABQ8GTV6_9PEZI|nr:DNA replication/checkpoint protein [Macrophomina phaseolina]
MASVVDPALADQCNAIRVDLKAWEKEFAKSNGGRKAGRADIKANQDIAARYKEYHRLRDILDGKSKPQPPAPASPKRKADPPIAGFSQTPTKKARTTAATPTRRGIDILRHPRDDMLHLSPSKLFSPTAHLQPAMLGPTPQKDGIVLGLFDLLPTDSPTKQQPQQRTVLGALDPNNLQTPKKRKTSDLHTDDDEDDELQWSGKMARMGRTPVSEGKRHFLDQFATPQKRRGHDQREAETPSSRGQATTPVFLRRDFRPMPALAEQPTSPRIPRKPRSFTRTLSTILQERRREKEEDARKQAEAKRQAELEAEAAERENDPDDDEEEAMREMEDGYVPAPAAPAEKPSNVLVEDSQFDMKLGADGENVSDSEGSEAGATGQPRRLWKKKGAKRQTRRVNMRPVRSRPPPQQPQTTATLDSGDESDATVAETQLPANQAEPPSEAFDDSDSTAVEDERDELEHTPKKRKAQSDKKKQAEAQEPATKKPAEKESVVKKAARKISAQAHANFRKLNIKNKNSKANGRGWGRNRR